MRPIRIPTVIPLVLCAVISAAACQSSPALPAPPIPAGPPAIPDAQPAVDAPLFLGQNAFSAPLGRSPDFSPVLATARVDSGNSGVVNGPAPLGRAPVTGSAALPILPPLLWVRRGLTTGCQIDLVPGLTKSCLAAIDAATLTVQSRWLPPGQDLNLASAVADEAQHILVTTRQRHLFVVARPDSNNATFRVVRDIDLNSHLTDGQGLLATITDANGILWFTSGGPPPTGPPSTDTTVGYVTPDDQVVTTTLANQRAETGLAVDQGNVFLTTAPAGAADQGAARGQVYQLTAVGGLVQTVWRETYDAGSGAKPGASTRGPGSPVVLLGNQYLAVTDNSDAQSHLLVYLRGPLPPGPARAGSTSTSTSTTTTGAAGTTTSTAVPTATSTATTAMPTASTSPTAPFPGTPQKAATEPSVTDSRLVCSVALFAPGASAVTNAAIGYSSAADGTSVVVTNGYHAPPPLTGPSDDGPANNINQMALGVTRIDVLADGSGCQTRWTTALRLKTAPVLSTTTGLLYGYTQDEGRAARGTYIWYFVAVDFRSGRVVWRQRVGAGSTKNDNRQPTFVGANGVLYQTLPLGLVWMRDVAQQP